MKRLCIALTAGEQEENIADCGNVSIISIKESTSSQPHDFFIGFSFTQSVSSRKECFFVQ